MNITLTRKIENEYGTFGEITNETGNHLCYTLEPKWRDNEQNVSCVPVGIYTCVHHDSPDHPNTWEVTGVPDRNEVLIHTGNYLKDTKGCILVGGVNSMNKTILFSMKTLDYLHTVLDNSFTLTIINAEQPLQGASL